MDNKKIGKWHITNSNGKIVIACPTTTLKTGKSIANTVKVCNVAITRNTQGKLYLSLVAEKKSAGLSQKHASLATVYKSLYSQEEQDISRVVQDLSKFAK